MNSNIFRKIKKSSETSSNTDEIRNDKPFKCVDELNSMLLDYTDLRSIKKFLKQYNIQLIKAGKKYFIRKDDFEKILENLFGTNNKVSKMPENKGLFNEKEKQIYKNLQNKISQI